MASRTALITGIAGQDAAYLARLLLGKGYEVFGVRRGNSSAALWRLEALDIAEDVQLVDVDLLEITSLISALEVLAPTEVYNLAAQSHVAASFEMPILTGDVNALGTMRLLEAMRSTQCEARLYQASSSEMFGKVGSAPQSETTAFYPRSPYGVAKLYAHWSVVNYRETYNFHASSGILYNHESPLRGVDFVTRKISIGLARIHAGLQKKISLGNLNAKRDWGFAQDYVYGMWLMLQQPRAQDYVLATGISHTVRDFVELAGTAVGIELEWRGKGRDEVGFNRQTGAVVVEVNPAFFRPAEIDELVGDAHKAKTQLGWEARTPLAELARRMVEADVRRLEAQLA